MRKIIILLISVVAVIVIASIIKAVMKNNDKVHSEKMKNVDNRYEILEEMTNYVTDVCNKNDLKLIPAFGTLLGLKREKEILRHDYDTDFFLLEEDWNKLLDIFRREEAYKLEETKVLWHKKIVLKHHTGLSSDISILHEYKDSMGVNVFLAFDKSGIRNGSFLWRTPTRVKFDKKNVLPLKETSTKYGKVYFPNKEDKLLEYWYGDWQTPVEY